MDKRIYWQVGCGIALVGSMLLVGITLLRVFMVSITSCSGSGTGINHYYLICRPEYWAPVWLLIDASIGFLLFLLLFLFRHNRVLLLIMGGLGFLFLLYLTSSLFWASSLPLLRIQLEPIIAP